MSPSAIPVRRFEDYGPNCKAAKVVLDPQAREEIILADAKSLALRARVWNWSRTRYCSMKSQGSSNGRSC